MSQGTINLLLPSYQSINVYWLKEFIYDERKHPYDIHALPCYIGLVTLDTNVEIISTLKALSFGHFDMRKKSDFTDNI